MYLELFLVPFVQFGPEETQLVFQNLDGCLVTEFPLPEHLLFQSSADRLFQHEELRPVFALVEAVEAFFVVQWFDFECLYEF